MLACFVLATGDHVTVFDWVTIALLIGVTIEAWGARVNANKATKAAEDAKLEVQLLRQMLDHRLTEVQDGIESARDRHGND